MWVFINQCRQFKHPDKFRLYDFIEVIGAEN